MGIIHRRQYHDFELNVRGGSPDGEVNLDHPLLDGPKDSIATAFGRYANLADAVKVDYGSVTGLLEFPPLSVPSGLIGRSPRFVEEVERTRWRRDSIEPYETERFSL